jgi:glycine hydroxymethyltransferase
MSGKWFKAVPYGVRRDDHRIDFDELWRVAKEHRPKILWCGTTAYPRVLEFDKFKEIADAVGAKLCADIAHIAGLVAAGVHPSPVGLADVVTSTTHKTLRGPRGGMILCKAEHRAAIDRAVFPGLQGGPHDHTTAGIAVAAKEAGTPEFRDYARNVVANAQALAGALLSRDFHLVTGGTDNHLILIDLTRFGLPGKVAAKALDGAGIETNYNAIPFDSRKPFDPSGLRIGTPAITSRGMGPGEMEMLAGWMERVVRAPDDQTLRERIAGEVSELCAAFPAPGLPLR